MALLADKGIAGVGGLFGGGGCSGVASGQSHRGEETRGTCRGSQTCLEVQVEKKVLACRVLHKQRKERLARSTE